MPTDVGVVDLLISFPSATPSIDEYGLRPLLKDQGSRDMVYPIEHVFRNIPNRLDPDEDPIEATLAEMDRFGIDIGLVGIGTSGRRSVAADAVAQYPNRFRPSIGTDPNDITGSVRRIREAHERFDIKAVSAFPAGTFPQVGISDPQYYPIYQTCIDLDLPIVVTAGVPGPRVPMDCQDVRHFDRVCYDFPELRIVMCHGAEPWEALAVKLMLKWPGLYYMTSAFAPKHYPKAVIDYANTRGADKVMYAGYFPYSLSIERSVRELADVPFRDKVWPKFLRENAMRVFKLDV